MNHWQHIENKILSYSGISSRLEEWRNQGAKIVFTNGCFDLLHYGHIRYLAEARALGSHLVVGLNADASVSRLKGSHRPIKAQESRALILAALECVDAVILFEEDTPLSLIEVVRPEVLVKGGDWAPEQIVGHQLVASYGGQTRSLKFVEGYSTSALEQKIKRESQD